MANLRLFTETPPGVSGSPSLIQFYFKVESMGTSCSCFLLHSGLGPRHKFILA